MEEQDIKWVAGFIECDLCGSMYLCCYHEDIEKIECNICGNMARYEQRTVEEWKNARAPKKIRWQRENFITIKKINSQGLEYFASVVTVGLFLIDLINKYTKNLNRDRHY